MPATSVAVIKHADELAQHWQHAMRHGGRIHPTIDIVGAASELGGARAAPLAPEPRYQQEVRAAGVPTGGAVTDYDLADEAPNAIIGGVGRLFDVGTAGDKERLHRRHGAELAAPARGIDSDVSRGTYGGWIPAEPVDAHGVGFREGSTPWRRHLGAAAESDAVRGLMRDEHAKAARFFGQKEEAEDVDAVAAARAARLQHERGERVVAARQGARANPHYVADVTEVGYREQPAVGPCSGFRPGSAAARRAAGGLYEGPGFYRGAHSGRVVAADDARAEQQRQGAKLAVAKREAARRREEAAHDLRRAQREASAFLLTQDPEAQDYMERVARRKSIDLKLNMVLAPYDP